VSGPARPLTPERPRATASQRSTGGSSTPAKHRRSGRASTAAAPRRRSGPAKGARAPSPRGTGAASLGTQLRPAPLLGALVARTYRAGRTLPESRLLDRLLRGRAWIALLAVLLIGLVALNVSLLKLNRAAGRHAETAKSLRIKNTQLRTIVSRLGSSERLQREGRNLGLVMPAAGEVRYLSARKGDGRRAARELRTELLPPPGSYEEVSSGRGEFVPAVPQNELPPPAPTATAPTGAATPPAPAPTEQSPPAAPTTGTAPAPTAGGGTQAGGAQAVGTAGGAGG
jgi:hypothetical protein